MTNALVIGASGMVGGELYRELERKDYNVFGTHYIRQTSYTSFMDMRSPRGINATFGVALPDVVFICAYGTAVDWCERNPTKSRKVNVDGIINILKACDSFDAMPVFFSSGYVFDGDLPVSRVYDESDKPDPISIYGKQKLEVEMTINRGIIVRSIGVFGANGINFVNQVRRAAELDAPIYVPNDQYMNPISAKSLAQRTLAVYENGNEGIFHIAGRNCVSKVEWAFLIAKLFGVKSSLVVSVPTKDLNQAAPRPFNACLGSEWFDNENLHSLEEELYSLRSAISV